MRVSGSIREHTTGAVQIFKVDEEKEHEESIRHFNRHIIIYGIYTRNVRRDSCECIEGNWSKPAGREARDKEQLSDDRRLSRFDYNERTRNGELYIRAKRRCNGTDPYALLSFHGDQGSKHVVDTR